MHRVTVGGSAARGERARAVEEGAGEKGEACPTTPEESTATETDAAGRDGAGDRQEGSGGPTGKPCPDQGVRRRGVERSKRRAQVPPMRELRGFENRARLRKVILRAVLISVILGIAGFTFVEIRLKPTLKELAEAKATEVGTTAVNDALSETSALDIRYEDLMDWKTDGSGNIVAVQPNTGEINRIAASTTSRVQSVLRQIRDVKISLPLGQVFGSALLAGVGPWVKVSVIPIGVVSTTVTDTFEVAGINQLRHKIYLQLRANMKILVPLVSSNVTIDTSMPIAEAIILGDVPNFYMSTAGNPGGVLQGVTGITP